MNMDIPAVLLVNLGTPLSPAPADVRKFLRTFLGDRRVVEIPPVLWKPLLEGIILRTRPKHSARLYQSIWDIGEVTGSPLQYWSERQRDALAGRLGESAHVTLAMRYSEPTIGDTLSELRDRGYRRVLVVPLYPQYAASTVASVNDEVARWLLAERDQMAVSVLHSYPDFPPYIEALALAVEKHWAEHGELDPSRGDRLVLSFHSIPMSVHKAGDPYRNECELTARLLAQRLHLDMGSLADTAGACPLDTSASTTNAVVTAGAARTSDVSRVDNAASAAAVTSSAANATDAADAARAADSLTAAGVVDTGTGGRGNVATAHGVTDAHNGGGDVNTAAAATRGECVVTYQSVFGPAQWIGPATIDTVRALGRAHARRVDVICPGFTADCLETLQEINMLNREEFVRAGGGQFHYIPWANAEQPWLAALEQLVRRELPTRSGD